jgi:hypothetical protein
MIHQEAATKFHGKRVILARGSRAIRYYATRSFDGADPV